jgi:hypothetical protein
MHKSLAKHVQFLSIDTLFTCASAPGVVAPRIAFDENGVSGIEQHLGQFWVLGKFRSENFEHDVVANYFPVFTLGYKITCTFGLACGRRHVHQIVIAGQDGFLEHCALLFGVMRLGPLVGMFRRSEFDPPQARDEPCGMFPSTPVFSPRLVMRLIAFAI